MRWSPKLLESVGDKNELFGTTGKEILLKRREISDRHILQDQEN